MCNESNSEIKKMVADFRASLAAGEDADINDRISAVADQQKETCFRELLSVELHELRKNGREPDDRSHIDRYPDRADIVEELLSGIDSFRASIDSTVDLVPVDGEQQASNQSAAKEPAGKRLAGLVQRYRLIKKLGQGGFGEAWLVKDEKLDGYVAIKGPRTKDTVSPRLVEGFLAEARKMRALECRGVVPIHDVVEEDGVCFVVMKYAEGGSLAGKMPRSKEDRQPVMSPDEAAEFIAKVADTLHRIHLKDFVHRDIKPDNILLDENDEPLVADFGLAADENELYDEPARRSGTRQYMSPEQARGESNRASPASDIYSLGVVLYQLITGRLPYDDVAKNPDEYLEIVASGATPRRSPQTINPDVSSSLDEICMKCLAIDSSARYQSAKKLATDLRGCHLSGSKTLARRRLMRWLSIGLATACLIFAGPALVELVESLIEPPPPSESPAFPFGEWVPLFEREIAIEAGKVEPMIAANRDGISISPGANWSMLSFGGEFHGEHCDVRFQTEINQSNDAAGFYWWLREDPNVFPEKELKCLVLLLRRGNNPEQIEVKFQEFRVLKSEAKFSSVVIGPSKLKLFAKSQPFACAPGRPVAVELGISNGNTPIVKIDETVIEMESMPIVKIDNEVIEMESTPRQIKAIEWPGNASTRFGLICSGKQVVFQNAAIRVLKEKN